MPKVAYSEAQREQIRRDLVAVGLELMTKQGIQHTTVEQIYQKVGISRSFFYTFFPTKEDLVVEMLYLQQPRVVAYARQLLADPSWTGGRPSPDFFASAATVSATASRCSRWKSSRRFSTACLPRAISPSGKNSSGCSGS